MRTDSLGLSIMVLLTLLGCGYRPLGSAPVTPEPPTLAIPLFVNRSTEVGLEAILARALVNAFAVSKAVRVVNSPNGADLVLEGKVRSIDNTSVAFQDVTRSTVRRVTLRLEIDLRQRGGKVLWKDSMVIQEDYVVDPNYHIGEATKSEGLRRAAYTMARRVMDKILLVI